MKRGVYFEIPENPGDVDAMRREASLLDEATRPAWLEEADRDYYLYVGSRSAADLAGEQRAGFLAEAEELRASGVVVDPGPEDGDTVRLYVPAACEYETWSIGMYAGPSPTELRPAPGAVNPVLTREDVTDVAAVFVADPFMVRSEGAWMMFFELLNWRANKGEIGLATSEDGLRWKYERRVLVEPFHLSYPQVFAHENEWYMIPETRQAGEVRLYRAEEFPWEWSCAGTLLEGDRFVDASVFFRDDRWWMFVGDSASGKHDTLRLYGAEAPAGPWTEHPRSPVVCGDARVARPAGRVIADGSRVFRWAQNCADAYGVEARAIAVEELSAEKYREGAAPSEAQFGPSGSGWNARGMHHVDACRIGEDRWLACVDGWTRSGQP